MDYKTIVLFIVLFYACSAFLLAAIYADNELKPSIWTIFTLGCPVVNTIVLLYVVIKKLRIVVVKESFKNFIRTLKEIR